MKDKLPPHLQESIEEKFRIKWFSGSEWHHNSQTAITISKHSNSYLLELEGYIAGYRQAYSDLIAELGPVVEALTELIQPLKDTSITTVGQYDSYVCEEAEQVLKHLKERILNVE